MLARALFRFWRSCAVSSWAMGHWGATRAPSAHWSDWSVLAETSLTERAGVWGDAEEADLLVIECTPKRSFAQGKHLGAITKFEPSSCPDPEE